MLEEADLALVLCPCCVSLLGPASEQMTCAPMPYDDSVALSSLMTQSSSSRLITKSIVCSCRVVSSSYASQ